MATQTIALSALKPSKRTQSADAGAPSPSPAAPQADADDEDTYRLHRRFDRMGRLVGDRAMARLFQSHVAVIGLGGVGSWAAESLVRSGVGRLTIVDFDLVCVTNANRQLHAMKGTTGKPKAEVMAERLRMINPRCEVEAIREFYNEGNSAEILGRGPDLVIDAIDNLAAKTHLIATCYRQGIPLVVSGGASGRLDPTRIREADITEVGGDPFLAATRKILRQRHEMPRGDARWGIPAIYSTEAPLDPLELDYDGGQGFKCVCPQGQNSPHACEHRNVIYGTASFVTGAFGLACAAAAVRTILGDALPHPVAPVRS
ncbi:MAG: tRNA threonylcarbamoyladenosine dehydratase [Myxococcales bacterium]|nr:tRNA threonylcarbamoyladenosine dehydratase [Myxococcales bacterium]MCB9567510.1 tRNA threonylcarbamoyladenosine dehydratase [Myxococcales bacterium]MCB9700619.1 tRNA threonylcarbamoyladenosine dehydratase [Myxococcales bacterium]